MAEYLSQYTGQEIDQKLSEVDSKINKADIVNSFEVGDAESPASSALTKEMNDKLLNMEETLEQDVVRTDSGEQIINGKKKFQSEIDALGGINVPATKRITIADEPTQNTDVVNLSMLKKHGISEDSTGAGSGLTKSLLTTGYYKFQLAISNLAEHTATPLPDSLAVSVGGVSKFWLMSSLFTSIFADSRFGGYVKTSDYTADMLGVQGQISALTTNVNSKVSTSTYNTKMSSLDASISSLSTGKVDTSTYNTKMTALDTSISNINTALLSKVEVGTYNTKMSSLDTSIAGKVDTTTYDTKMAALDGAIAGRVTLAKTNTTSTTVNASGSAALPDFNLVNLCQLLITAKWGSGNVVDTFRVTITLDGTVKTESLVQKSTAGTLTFAGSVVSSKLRLTMTNANTTTAAVVDYNLIASF